MTSFGDVLMVIGAAAGLAVFLVMAAAPLLVDHHRPRSPQPARRVVVVPAQRGSSDPVHAVLPRA